MFEAEELSYGELERRANRLAHYLRARGVGPETVVGLCLGRSLELIVGLLAILKAGGAYLPLDPDYPPQRLAFMLADAGARVLITQDGLVDAASRAGGRRSCPPSCGWMPMPPPSRPCPPSPPPSPSTRSTPPMSSIPPAPPEPQRASVVAHASIANLLAGTAAQDAAWTQTVQAVGIRFTSASSFDRRRSAGDLLAHCAA